MSNQTRLDYLNSGGYQSGRMIAETGDIVNHADLLLLTTQRLRAYAEGRRFRVNHVLQLTELIPVQWIRFDIAEDIDLLFARQSAADGSYDYEIFTGAQISDATGFDDPVPVYRSNNKTGIPVLTPVVDVFGGSNPTATATGVPNVTRQLRASSQGSSRTTGTLSDELPRGFPPTSAYARLTLVGTATANAVLEYEFDQG